MISVRRRFPQPDTLVAIIPTLRDFAIAERERWYRIPCRSAPGTLSLVRWLAFYHPAAFGAHKWAIHFFASIEGIDRVLRRDLIPDEPQHPRALEPYFQLKLGAMSRLDHPVPSTRRRRIVFIPTTLAKLRAAEEINDLYHESPLEDDLWRVLRSEHIPAERQYYVAEGKTSYCLDFAVLCSRAGVDVECDGDSWHLRPETVIEDNARDNFMARLGWSVLRFSSRQLSEPTIGDAVRVISETSERLGGVELPNRANRRFDRAGHVVESTACGSSCSPPGSAQSERGPGAAVHQRVTQTRQYRGSVFTEQSIKGGASTVVLAYYYCMGRQGSN